MMSVPVQPKHANDKILQSVHCSATQIVEVSTCSILHQCQSKKNIYCTSVITRYAQTAQTSAEHGNLEDPDFGLWTPRSKAWSGSPPKLYHLVLVPCPTPIKNFVKIRSQVCE